MNRKTNPFVSASLLALMSVSTFSNMANAEEETMYLEHDGGRIAFEVIGDHGPLIIAIPGIGDLRSTYRHIAPALADSGFRFVSMDLRGQGETSRDWNDYSSYTVGEDVVALIDHFGENEVYVIGNSLGGAASVVAAAKRPEAVKGVVMLNPFVRNEPMNPLMLGMIKLMLSGPWGTSMWMKHYDSLHIHKPADYDQHAAEIRASLKRPGRQRAFRKVGFTGHAKASTYIDSVKAPVTVMMGMDDKDIGDTQAMLEFLAESFDADTVAVPGAGHYLHAEQPELVMNTVLESIAKWRSDVN